MIALAWRLTRLGGRSAALSTGLTAFAVVATTLLLQFAVACNFAFAERADRTEWREPVAVEHGSAVLASAIDYYGDDQIVRIDLARLDETAPVPPGLDAFPAPGEVWVSPALAELLEGVPAEDFLDRYEGTIAGVVGPEALAHDNELLAVVGREADSAAMTTERSDGDMVSPRTIDGFAEGKPSMVYGVYRPAAVVATMLMAVPVAVFGAAAARLTVARRDERLAALRLIGATPGQVVRLTLIETVLAAVAGSIVGTLLWMASTPLFARIPIDGGPWYVSDLWGGAAWMPVVAAAVPVMVAVSAVIGLRSVVISPLGVAKRVRRKGLGAIRLAVFIAVAVAFLIVSQMVGGGMVLTAIAVVLFGTMIGALNLTGPWAVQKIGEVLAATARGPARMLAARRLLDDPKAAWRAVAGVALAGFIAGSIALVPLGGPDIEPSATETLSTPVAPEHAEELASQAAVVLEGLAEVELHDRPDEVDESETIAVVTATTSSDELEHVRSILTATLAGDPPRRATDEAILSGRVLDSVRVGAIVVLAVVFATAALSAGVSAIGSVLDRRKTYRLLHLSGTPQSVLNAARRQETLLPLAVIGGASVLAGMALNAPLVGSKGLQDASGAVILGLTLVIGTAAVIGAGAASRPLLRSVMNDVSPRPD